MDLSGSVVDGEQTTHADELGDLAATVTASVGGDPRSTRVVLATASVPDAVGALAGTLGAGAVAAPISDRPVRAGTQSGDDVLARVEHADASLAVADDRHAWVLEAAGFARGDPVGCASSLWHRTSAPPPAEHPTGAALLMYTSGSTSRPKGVLLSRSAVDAIQRTNLELYAWRPDDIFLSMLPLTHLAGLTNCLSAIRSGVELVVCPSIVFAGRVRETLTKFPITVTGGVPYQLGRLFEPSHGHPVEAVRLVVSSAAPLTRPIVEAVRHAAPRAQIRNAYGLTEAFRSFVRRIDGSDDDLSVVGRPVPGTQADVRDGDLFLRGDNVMIGYWAHDEGTGIDDQGWFLTGDLAAADDAGNIRLLGRRSGLVNAGGEKLPVEVIEKVLHDEFGDRVAAHARGAMDGDDVVVAVAEYGSLMSLDALRERCARRLKAAFWPQEMVMVKRLPRTATGKIDRVALRELADSPSREVAQ